MIPFESILTRIRGTEPLVHFITNYVTVNDCANITLAMGGAPIMADDIREVEEIVDLCSALVINLGTLNARTVESMLLAGKRANMRNIPVIFDPTGVGASALRNESAARLLRELRFAVIKGNSSEIHFLADGMASSRGVNARTEDIITESTLEHSILLTQELSRATGAVIVMTGPIDVISGQQSCIVRNGHPLMARITGSGCMSAALIGTCAGANPERLMEATVTAVCAMGVCGELAYERLHLLDAGLGTYHSLIIDCIGKLNSVTLEHYQQVEYRV